jgi:hypothetical protein
MNPIDATRPLRTRGASVDPADLVRTLGCLVENLDAGLDLIGLRQGRGARAPAARQPKRIGYECDPEVVLRRFGDITDDLLEVLIAFARLHLSAEEFAERHPSVAHTAENRQEAVQSPNPKRRSVSRASTRAT